MGVNPWAKTSQRSQVQASQVLSKQNLTSGCSWILTSSLSSKRSIAQDKPPNSHRSLVYQPLDLLVVKGYTPVIRICLCISQGSWIASKHNCGINPGEEMSSSFSLSLFLSLFSLSLSYALWKTKQKHFTAFTADKNLLSNSEKDHFCSSKEILMLVCFIGANKKQYVNCCFLGLPFYI